MLACLHVWKASRGCSQGRGHGVYRNPDVMTDEDKETTMKNGRGLRSDEAHVDTCSAETAQWRDPKAWEGT